MLKFKNNASTTLSGSINDTQTSITVNSASAFPVLSGADTFYATMYEVSGATEINIEIVKVTATTGAVWTIVRAQDGTTARARNGVATCYVELRVTAATVGEMLQAGNNLSDLSSAATARTNLGLGGMATQDPAAVAITGGTISGVAIEGLDSQTTLTDNVDATKQARFELSGVSTGTMRTLTVPNASGTLALTSDLDGYQEENAQLTGLAALAANGLVARTSSGAYTARTISQPAAGITVTNGDGVSGNPTLALANDLAAVEALATTGFVKRTGADTWTAGTIADGDVPSALTGKSYNGLSLTAAAVGYTIAGGTTSKTLTISNTMTLAGTDGSTLNIGAGGTLGTGAFATIANYLTTATASSTYQTQAGMSSYLTTSTASSTYAPIANPTHTGTVTTPNLAFNTAGGRITGDLSNATLANRLSFQTSTTNGTTAVQAIANGTGTASYYVAFAGSDPANAAYGWLSATTSGVDIYSDKTGTGTVQPVRVLTGGTVRVTAGALGGFDLATGLREARTAMGANDIDLRAANFFSKTISGATTFTVSNVPTTGTTASFILDLTNGGSAAITWWSGVKWAGGTAPTLTSAGRDVLGFFTHDGGTTWTGLVLGKDLK